MDKKIKLLGKKSLKILFIILLILILTILILAGINLYMKYSLEKKYSETLKAKNTLNVDGINISYKEYGKGSPLLLLHGFLGSSEDYSLIINELSKNNKVIAVDLPGFGLSDKKLNYDYSKRNMASTLYKFMNKKGYKNFMIMGNSMGGEVALNMAYLYSKNVDALVLIDSGGYLNEKKAFSIMSPNILLNYLTQKIVFRKYFYDNSKINKEIFEKDYLLNSYIPSKVLWNFNKCDDSGSIKENIKEIKCPTLIIWGDKDKAIPVNYAYKFNNDIESSTTVILENCGHMPCLEKPDILLKEFNRFLKIVKKSS